MYNNRFQLYLNLQFIKYLINNIPVKNIKTLLNKTTQLYRECIPESDWKKQHNISNNLANL